MPSYMSIVVSTTSLEDEEIDGRGGRVDEGGRDDVVRHT